MSTIYKITYKHYTPGYSMGEFALEITVYGENLDIIRERLQETINDMDLNPVDFKMVKIEKK